MPARHYFVLVKKTGARLLIDNARTADLFTMISQLTGLDPDLAEVILNGGKSIRHPAYEFTAAPTTSKRSKTKKEPC